MNISVNNFQDKWKESVILMWRFFRQANWNGTTCYWLGQRRSADGENNSAYLCLLLFIQFLSRLCNTFLRRLIALKKCYLMMNFEKTHFPVFKISVKCKFDGQTLIKCDFLEGRLPQYFFQEICSFGCKQTIHKVSIAFIVKNWHPRTSLTLKLIPYSVPNLRNLEVSGLFCLFIIFFKLIA